MTDLVVNEDGPTAFIFTNTHKLHRGLGPVNDLVELSEELQNDGWMGEFAAVASLGASMVSAAFNPIATGVGWVVSWIIDHIYPLPDLLQQLTGDPEEIAAGASTWVNISKALHEEANELTEALSGIADQKSETLDAYRNRANELISVLQGEGDLALGIAGLLQKQGSIVEFAYNLVRDLISEAIGMFTQTVAELVFSIGTATPLVVSQISTWVADKVAEVTKWINRGLDAFAAASKLAKTAVQVLRGLGAFAARLLRLVNKPADALNDAAVSLARRASTRAADSKAVNNIVGKVDDLRTRFSGSGSSGSNGPEIPHELIKAKGPLHMRKILDEAGVDLTTADLPGWVRSLKPQERLEFARTLSGNEAKRVLFPRMDPQEQDEFFNLLFDNDDRQRLAKYASLPETKPVNVLQDVLGPDSGAAGTVVDGTSKVTEDEVYEPE